MTSSVTTRRARTAVNRALHRWTDYELRRRGPAPDRRPERGPVIHTPPVAPDPAELAARAARVGPHDRLLRRPTFVLSTMRAGSTLLRMMLDSHPRICAPHELHLRRVEANALGMAAHAIHECGLERDQLRHLLWDRLLHRELVRSGKTHFVNKTPTDALIWDEILACWPDARFVFLHRHPAAVVDSWQAAHGRTTSRDELAADVHAFTVGMEQARAAHGGLVVRYEDLTTEPGREGRRLCEFLGVGYDPAMIDYASVPHSGRRRGLGDWSDTLRAGRIRPATAVADGRVPAILAPVAAAWGYA